MAARPRFGWRRDPPDPRDFPYAAPAAVARQARALVAVDLRDRMPPVQSQGSLGSCTAHAIGAAVQYCQARQALAEQFAPSRLFLYYNERRREGTVRWDAGAIIRDGFKSIAAEGVCPEAEWPYRVGQFRAKPPAACYRHALQHQAIRYERVPQTLAAIKACLAEGFPFVFGFSVFSGAEADRVRETGVIPLPQIGEAFRGGHAVLGVGVSEGKRRVVFRNSWGRGWGDGGYGYLPLDYVLNPFLAADFWTVRRVEAG